MQKITPFLWFDHQAEEAARFYTSIFKNSKIHSVTRAGEAVQSVSFQVDGQELIALNGGPHYKFTPAISMFVNCETQVEVDELWKKLTDGGEEVQCGWLTDKFGLSWQIVPAGLTELLNSPNAEKSRRAMEAMLKMKKLDLAQIQQAYDQG